MRVDYRDQLNNVRESDHLPHGGQSLWPRYFGEAAARSEGDTRRHRRRWSVRSPRRRRSCVRHGAARVARRSGRRSHRLVRGAPTPRLRTVRANRKGFRHEAMARRLSGSIEAKKGHGVEPRVPGFNCFLHDGGSFEQARRSGTLRHCRYLRSRRRQSGQTSWRHESRRVRSHAMPG
jgi:hypothetical protein